MSQPEDILAAYLDSPDRADGVLTLAELDGYLAAIAIAPEPIAPEEWLPPIWNGAPPAFADAAQAESVTRALHDLHAAIVRQVEAGTYAPLLDMDENDTPLPQAWAAGFMLGVDLRPDAWAALFTSEDDDTIAYPILALCEDVHGQPLLDLSKKDRAVLVAQSPSLLAQAVIDIADYWQQRNKPPPAGAIPVRTTPKIGRNVPCPCGSGKKYKKCCGA